MELKAYFFNIHKVIIGHLEQAESEIAAAIAWFTDREIFEVLCTKARSGIKVSVALIGDEINQGPGGLNFLRLTTLGGVVTFLPPGTRDEPTMHHKFCVIDGNTVITGSYNWSHKARSNDENITVVTGSTDFAANYLDVFHNLLARVGQEGTGFIDIDAAHRRLEMIRNLILLGEQDDVSLQLRKLRPVAEALKLSKIMTALECGEYRTALEEIEVYLHKATAVVVSGYADIPRLRLQLETLEFRLESLADEKAELERRLIIFNRRHDETLGEVIQRLLKARAELARMLASENKEDKEGIKAEAAARDAEEAYQDYSRQHEELRNSDPVPELDEDAERELKAIYRKACSLCHPDKVTEDKKEAAHRIFVELQDAYKLNDLARIREIYETLKVGGIPGVRSNTLSEADALKSAIVELEFSIARLVAELKALQESDGVKFMEAAGITEAAWKCFFERQQEMLEKEFERTMSDIRALKTKV